MYRTSIHKLWPLKSRKWNIFPRLIFSPAPEGASASGSRTWTTRYHDTGHFSRPLCYHGNRDYYSLWQNSMLPSMSTRSTSTASRAKVPVNDQPSKPLENVQQPLQYVLGDDPPTLHPTPQFENHKEVYKSKTTRELVRAYLVFTLCSFDFLVNNHVKVRSQPY